MYIRWMDDCLKNLLLKYHCGGCVYVFVCEVSSFWILNTEYSLCVWTLNHWALHFDRWLVPIEKRWKNKQTPESFNVWFTHWTFIKLFSNSRFCTKHEYMDDYVCVDFSIHGLYAERRERSEKEKKKICVSVILINIGN